jgi:class 3 adenylate cyclase
MMSNKISDETRKLKKELKKEEVESVRRMSYVLMGVCNKEEISFAEGYSSGCVGVIDVINSTCTTASLCREKLSKYYSMFLNTVTSVVRSFGGTVVKNVGDGILYYFPSQEDMSFNKEPARWLECSLAVAQLHHAINMKFSLQGLPRIDYRISLDYGEIMLAKSGSSLCEDIFGTTVSMCVKINRMAKRNGVVVGSDLYEIAKNKVDYRFHLIGSYNIGLRLEYPIYSLERKLSNS